MEQNHQKPMQIVFYFPCVFCFGYLLAPEPCLLLGDGASKRRNSATTLGDDARQRLRHSAVLGAGSKLLAFLFFLVFLRVFAIALDSVLCFFVFPFSTCVFVEDVI